MNYQRLLLFALRFIVYALLMAGLYYIFYYDATHNSGEVKITENSLTEIFQEIFVFLVAVGFFIAGRKSKELAPILNLLSLLFLMSFIREFNNHIDFWFYIVLPFLGLFVFLLVRNFKKPLIAFQEFIELKSSGSFFIGFLVTYLFSRLFGKTSFWMELMGDAYHRTAKNMAEEGIELLGYTIILISVVELLVIVFKKKPINIR
ncbi:MAG: hypothetical protein HQ541_12665 [Mariniphaga sp.]|nr:hypothetical protein [Mariniphaga sp.]